jgi:AmiR/NasT family two-component response regulator
MEPLEILIADDDSLHVMSLRQQLEELGHQVVAEAYTGREAVLLASKRQPDLALLDIVMPDMDGIEAARRINADQPMPIVLLSAHSEDTLAQRADEAGVFAYLVKPVTAQDLLPALLLASSRYREFQVLRQEVSDLHQALETRKLVERAKGVLMRRLHLTEEEAFRRLQKRSQDENRKLRHVAEAVITADEMFLDDR